MTHEEIEDETARLLGKINALGWTRPYVETSCVVGPFPWRVAFGGFGRRATLIQGLNLEDAFAKAWRWIGNGALETATPMVGER